MADIPTPLAYGTITGHFIAFGADSIDAGESPDAETLNGTVTIVPTVRIARVTTSTVNYLAVQKDIEAKIVNGVLYAPDGTTGLRVLASDSPGITPTPFQYKATYALEGVTLQPTPVTFSVPAGGSVDLATVFNIPVGAPVQTVVITGAALTTMISDEVTSQLVDFDGDSIDLSGITTNINSRLRYRGNATALSGTGLEVNDAFTSGQKLYRVNTAHNFTGTVDLTKVDWLVGADAVSASATEQGIVELATTAETTTGTDDTRAVTPAGVKAVADTKAALSHTHTIANVTGLQTAIDAKADLTAIPELARDTLGTALVAGSGVTITPNDGADTITIATTGATAVHTHVIGDVTGLQTALDSKVTGFTDPNADRIVFWDDSAGSYAALSASTGLVITGTAITVQSASETQQGIVELATTAETLTGTDAVRATTPAGVKAVADTKAALSHTHTTLDITGFTSSVNTQLANATVGTSTTSRTVGLGSKTFTTQAGLAFTLGQVVMAFQTSNPTNWMSGRITSYPGTTLTINSTNTGGLGTYTDWTVVIGGAIDLAYIFNTLGFFEIRYDGLGWPDRASVVPAGFVGRVDWNAEGYSNPPVPATGLIGDHLIDSES